LVECDRIELLAATPLNNGYQVTAGNGEHTPLTHSPLCFLTPSKGERRMCVLKHTNNADYALLYYEYSRPYNMF
jgi:hypothetical protein